MGCLGIKTRFVYFGHQNVKTYLYILFSKPNHVKTRLEGIAEEQEKDA